jgi:hypothetical protein
MTSLKHDQQIALPVAEDQTALLQDIKQLLNLFKFNQSLSTASAEKREEAWYRDIIWQTINTESDIPPFAMPAMPGSEPTDLSQFSSPESDRLLAKLQSMQLLPNVQPDLKKALPLLNRCTEFPKDFINPLLLNTVLNSKQKGWNTLCRTYSQCTHKGHAEIREALEDYLKAVFYPRLLRGAKKLPTTKNISPSLKQARIKWEGKSTSFTNFANLILFKHKDIADLATFSDHWHAPL